MKQYIIPATVAALAAFSYAQEAAPTAPAPQVPQSGVVVKGERVFINGHELPPDVAAELIRSGAISELTAPLTRSCSNGNSGVHLLPRLQV